VSRWKSPQASAKRAERAAKEAEQLRKEKRYGWFTIIGIAVVSMGLIVADYVWLKARAQRRWEEHQKLHHRPVKTNSPSSQVGGDGNTNSNVAP
jgi:hypothetical protein